MDLIDLEDESIDAEVMDSLAVSMDNFRVSFIHIINVLLCSVHAWIFVKENSILFDNYIYYLLVNKLLCYSLVLVTFSP
jgi:hypothetical protein